MFMKRLFIFTFISLCALGMKAQAYDPLFLFDQFINAKIHFKNRSVTSAPMNYDAVNDKMYFKQQEDLMELTNTNMIDSIVWAGLRKFVPKDNGFLEVVKMDNGTAYIAWRVRNVNVGSKGALGSVTQGKVESISIRSMGVFSATDAAGHSADVYQQKNVNEYYIPVKGKLQKVTAMKHLYKLFPEQKEAIREYADKEKIRMNEPLLVLQILNFCMGL